MSTGLGFCFDGWLRALSAFVLHFNQCRRCRNVRFALHSVSKANARVRIKTTDSKETLRQYIFPSQLVRNAFETGVDLILGVKRKRKIRLVTRNRYIDYNI